MYIYAYTHIYIFVCIYRESNDPAILYIITCHWFDDVSIN